MATKKKLQGEKTVIQLKDVERDLYGYLGGEDDYTPEVFESMGIPKEHRYSVMVSPMSDEDCTLFNTINAQTRVDIALWGAENDESGVIAVVREKLSKAEEGQKFNDILTPRELAVYSAYVAYVKSLDDNPKIHSIARKYCGKLTNHKHGEEMTDDIWNAMPLNIKRDIVDRVESISTVSYREHINL
jgi:hypothetical protein